MRIDVSWPVLHALMEVARLWRREQEEREARQRELRDLGLPPNADDMDPGALSDADPHTTNLYVGNLAPGIDEELLKKA